MATTQSLGRVSIIPRGEFDELTQYERLDLVKYLGSSYLALKTSVGNLPTDDNYFQLIAAKGDIGETGPTGKTGETGAKGRDVSSIVMSNDGVNHLITAIYSDGQEEQIGSIKDGEGGDMYTAVYDTNGDGVVDYAEALSDGENTITPTTIISKANKQDVYTKSEVDKKIEGVTIDWSGLDNKPFESVSNDLSVVENALGLPDATKNKLSVALSTDKYNNNYTYSKDELCINDNIVYKSLVDNNIGHPVTDTNYFEPTTIGKEISDLKNTLNDYVKYNAITTPKLNTVSVDSFITIDEFDIVGKTNLIQVNFNTQQSYIGVIILKIEFFNGSGYSELCRECREFSISAGTFKSMNCSVFVPEDKNIRIQVWTNNSFTINDYRRRIINLG